MYLLKLALRPWRIAPASQWFAAGAVGVLLVLSGFLYWLEAGLGPVLAQLQGDQVITAYLDANVTRQDEPKIVDSIRTSLGAHGRESDVKMVDPHQFVGHLREQYPELARELEDLGSEMDSVVPRYISISGVFPESALARVKAVSGVESAESSKDRYGHIVGAFRALRWISKLLIAGLFAALAAGLIHLSRMNSLLHRDSMRLLKQWGAGEWVLRAPILMSGAAVGGLGGMVAFAGWLVAGSWLIAEVRDISPLLHELPAAGPAIVAPAMLLAGAALGAIAGLVGSAGFSFASAMPAGRAYAPASKSKTKPATAPRGGSIMALNAADSGAARLPGSARGGR